MNTEFVEFKSPPKFKNNKPYCPLCNAELEVLDAPCIFETDSEHIDYECLECGYEYFA